MNEQLRRHLFLNEMGIKSEWILRDSPRTTVTIEAAALPSTPQPSADLLQDHTQIATNAISNLPDTRLNITLDIAPETALVPQQILSPTNFKATLNDTQDTVQKESASLLHDPLSSLPPSAKSIAEMDWTTLENTVAHCRQCSLCEGRTQTVFGTGAQTADWLIIGEAPGEQEDKQGQPFVGQAGKLLDNMLHAIGLTRWRGVYIANVLKCRPPGNRDPMPEEILQCAPYLQRQIDLLKPKCILLLGRFAAQTLLKTETTIGKLRGQIHQYQNIPVVVTYHPAYLLRSPLEKTKAWADLCSALKLIEQIKTMALP